MSTQELSKKQKGILELCRNLAYQSVHPLQRHGAVLTKGGKIINASCNVNRYRAFADRFWHKKFAHGTVHAEIGAILGLDRSVTENSTVYVVRVNGDGKFRNSRPCDMCQSALSFCGVRTIFFTNENGELEKMKL